MNLHEFKARLMKDLEFAKEYHALEPEFRLAANIIALRNMRGLTQEQLAAKLGTKQAGIARIEARAQTLSAAKLGKLAEALRAQLQIELVPEEQLQEREIRTTDILKQAERRAREITLEAQRKAELMVDEAREKSDRLQEEADAYARDILRKLDKHLTLALSEIRGGIEVLEREETTKASTS